MPPMSVMNDHAVAKVTIPLMKLRRRIAAPKAQGLCGLCLEKRLQQGFTTGEMGFRGQFAGQQSQPDDVRFGSKADIAASPTNVCFTPESGHQYVISQGLA